MKDMDKEMREQTEKQKKSRRMRRRKWNIRDGYSGRVDRERDKKDVYDEENRTRDTDMGTDGGNGSPGSIVNVSGAQLMGIALGYKG